MKYRLAIILLVLLSACKVDEELGLTEETRIAIQNENPDDCPNWKSNEMVTITENTTLPSGCRYDRVRFEITRSDVVFDCNNAILNGLGKTKRNTFFLAYKQEEAPLLAAFFIRGSEDDFIENVTIKNCNISYYINGVNVNFGLKESTHHNLKNNINVAALEDHLRTLSPHNIQLENMNITANHKTAIYIQRYITDFKLKDSTIKANDIGIYLESGTKNNLISNTTFSKNGETTYDLASRKRKLRIKKREAIAIDSSAYNTIIGNTFINNAGGAIFLYKNCYENYKDESSLPRIQHSSFNIIENNTFSDERKGVWIASRQSREMENFNCGDPLVIVGEDNDDKYYEDFSRNNQIVSNVFNGVEKSIIVEDDNNIISNNTFTGESRVDLIIGTEIRSTYLNHPVKNTVVENNTFNSTATTSHVRILHGSTGSVFNKNSPAISIEESTEK
ncbi:MAG: right-handed parallel beta-helix repeat-containing protein [Cocleimonas sp.]|nr:right-handed parallel beta-helix repeat-containing protein [Cocleimonas sp.]